MTLSQEHLAHLREHRDEARCLLLAWFRVQARDLPWRHERSPYRIWVSEIMLQQTQVDTVRGYYERFIEQFPTVDALASAPLEAVLKLWEGLGYYSRARSLHRAAQEVVTRYAGHLPADPDALRALPGIGRYTAGAIASLAFGLPVPAVDGNVRRVMARVLAEPAPHPMDLEAAVAQLLPDEDPGTFAEALIELGATLCRPTSPHCLLCPWCDWCRARQSGDPEAFPRPQPRKALPHYDVAAAVTVREDSRILVAQRRQTDMLGGLWEFPGGKRRDGESLPDALRREMHEELGIEVAVGEHLIQLDHAYTHFRITLHAFVCRLVAGEPQCLECDDFRWATLEEIEALPMPVTDRRIALAVQRWMQT